MLERMAAAAERYHSGAVLRMGEGEALALLGAEFPELGASETGEAHSELLRQCNGLEPEQDDTEAAAAQFRRTTRELLGGSPEEELPGNLASLRLGVGWAEWNDCRVCAAEFHTDDPWDCNEAAQWSDPALRALEPPLTRRELLEIWFCTRVQQCRNAFLIEEAGWEFADDDEEEEKPPQPVATRTMAEFIQENRAEKARRASCFGDEVHAQGGALPRHDLLDEAWARATFVYVLRQEATHFLFHLPRVSAHCEVQRGRLFRVTTRRMLEQTAQTPSLVFVQGPEWRAPRAEEDAAGEK